MPPKREIKEKCQMDNEQHITDKEFQVEVIGCGDAYDGHHINASVLIKEAGMNLLVDCGPTVPAALFARQIEAEQIDVIYLTHAHPDHCLGLTTLLNWMEAQQRKQPLTIICQKSQWPVIEPLIDFASWPQSSLGFEIHRQDTERTFQLGPWQAQTSKTRHAVPNLSLHLTNQQGAQLFYSGDGLLTPAGEKLAATSDCVFVECETLTHHHSHGSWEDISPLERKPASQWWLYHIAPSVRASLSELTDDIEGLSLAKESAILSIGVNHVV